MVALEKAKEPKEAHREFQSECAGYCGAQERGTVYQQTFIDTYSKVAFCQAL
jgi:hypothetical protein